MMAYPSGSYTPRPMYPDTPPHPHPHPHSSSHPNPYPNTNFGTFPTANHSAAISAPALYRQNQQNQQQHLQQHQHQLHLQHQNEHQHQHQHQTPNLNLNPTSIPTPIQNQNQNQNQNQDHNHQPNQRLQPQPQQQQYYPNAYPNNTRSSPPLLPSLNQPQGAGSQVPLPNPSQSQNQNQHPNPNLNPNPNQIPNQTPNQNQIQIQIRDLGNGRPSSMPPPSSLPDATFARRAHLQPQRPIAIDRWPSNTNEEQRQMQEQYTQHAQANLYYNQQHRQPMSTTTSAPVSTFSPPHHQLHPTPGPASTPSHGPPQVTSLTSAFESSKPQLQTPATSPLEAQRVTFLLELNSVLLQEVVNLQNAGKTDVPATPQQPSSPPEQGSVTPASGQRVQQPSPPEDRGSATPAANQRTQQQGKVVFAKDYIEYMRRLQANLAYLASIAEQHSKPQNTIPQFPAIMDAPGASESENGKEGLKDLYLKMKELWPDYKSKV